MTLKKRLSELTIDFEMINEPKSLYHVTLQSAEKLHQKHSFLFSFARNENKKHQINRNI